MKPSTVGRLTAEGSANLFKGGWMSVASVVTVAASLLVLALVALLAVNLQHMMETVQDDLMMNAWLPEDFSETEARHVATIIERFDGVRRVEFISSDGGLDYLRGVFGDQAGTILAGLDGEANPLPPKVEVWVHDPGDMQVIAARIESETPIAEVSYHGEVVERINHLGSALQLAGITLVTLMLLATAFVIANTIRLTVHARRDEIRVMSLVGATDGFIRLPFLMEGILLGLAGAGLAAGATWVGYAWLLEQMGRSLPFVPLLAADPVLIQLAQILIGVGAVVGLLGSGMSLGRYLKAQGG